MKVKFTSTGLLLIAFALLFSGCNLIAAARKPSPRKASAQGLQIELESLKRDNEELRRNHQLALSRMDTLAKKLAADKAEQRRFRDMMATNFDLLEQSVSLSLSKSMGGAPVVKPDQLVLPTEPLNKPRRKNPPPPKAEQIAPPLAQPLLASREVSLGQGQARPQARLRTPANMPPMARPPQRGGPETALAANAPGNTPSPSSRMASPSVPRRPQAQPVAPAEGMTRPVGMTLPVAAAQPVAVAAGLAERRDEGDMAEDPDLIPPANPRKLKAHPEAKALYDRGFRHFARREFKQAVLVYQGFLERFPGDSYSDNAQFWIGESYFRQGKFAEAEAAYRNVLRNYEHRSTLQGYKTPDAIYRIGLTYLNRGDSRRASTYFMAVAERFPTTSSGRKAQRELASLMVKTAGEAKPAGAARGS